MALDHETLRRLREQALQEALQQLSSADTDLLAAWCERARAWAEIYGRIWRFGRDDGKGLGFVLRRVLRHIGWLDLLRLHKLIEQLPQLREIIRALGRLHNAQGIDQLPKRFFVPVRRIEEEHREIRTPLIPAEMRGLERSGEIARMLPVEALTLGHPRMRMLWHARRAERALLTYRVEGIEIHRECRWSVMATRKSKGSVRAQNVDRSLP